MSTKKPIKKSNWQIPIGSMPHAQKLAMYVPRPCKFLWHIVVKQ